MWTDVRLATAWAFLWMLFLTAAFALVRRPTARSARLVNRLTLPGILALALLVRLLPALWLPVGAGYDIESYRLVTDALLSGREVYTSVLGRHPYLPLQMYVMGGMAYLAQQSGVPYVVMIKLPAVAADVALTWLLFRTVVEGNRREIALYVALLYALNPVSILVTAYHGQFEAITLFLLVLAVWFWHVREQYRLSGTALGFAILNKTWPVVLLPVFLLRLRGWRARIIYALLALGIPVLFSVAYLVVFDAGPLPMLRRALTHRGVPGYWGPGAILTPMAEDLAWLQPVVDGLFGMRNWLLLAAIAFALWRTRRQTVIDASLTLLLCMFAVTVGFGIQWLVWIVPFGLLALEDHWTKVYSVAGAFMLAVHLYGLHMYPWLAQFLPADVVDWFVRLSALPVWCIVVTWAVVRLRHSMVERPYPASIQPTA